MTQTYKATVRGNHIEWKETPPDISITDYEVEVVVELSEKPGQADKRPFGLAHGEFVLPDDFNSALPEGVISEFEN